MSLIVWTSAADLARAFHVPIGTIHYWANQDDWPRIGRGKNVRYNHERAEETYAKRRPERVGHVETRPVIDTHQERNIAWAIEQGLDPSKIARDSLDFGRDGNGQLWCWYDEVLGPDPQGAHLPWLRERKRVSVTRHPSDTPTSA